MTSRYLIILSFALLLLSPIAHADLLVEPYLGYEMGGYRIKAGPIDVAGDINGVTLGGRLGVSLPLFFAALDYNFVNGQLKPDSGSNSIDYKSQKAFLVAGTDLPLVRLYGGVGFWNALQTKLTNSETKFSGMPSLKIGASFTGIPLVALNLEYIYVNYDKSETQTGDFDFTTSSFLASVSAPLEF